jgi:hypothetical protein
MEDLVGLESESSSFSQAKGESVVQAEEQITHLKGKG